MNSMMELTAWSLVVASFLMMGFFGYAAVTRSKVVVVFAAFVSAFVLNAMASQIFRVVEIAEIMESGPSQEEKMQPDMYILMAAQFMFGWAFFLGGYFAGRLRKRVQAKPISEQVVAPNGP